jgi:hypothetical protein
MNTILNQRRTLGPILGLATTLALILLGSLNFPAQSLALASAAERRVCPAGPPTCGYASLQAAVDAAAPGDVIKVATGVYTDMHSRPAPAGYAGPAAITQLVYLDKAVTIRGGYTTSNWSTSDPDAHPTTLNAQGQGRVLVIVGDGITPVVEGLRITGGNAAGQGGHHGGYDGGGGIYLNRAAATIRDNLIYSNSAGGSANFGGGLYLLNSLAVVSDNIIHSNRAENGDGLYVNAGSPTVSRNIIRDNGDEITGWAGGVYLAYTTATLTGNTITGNRGGYGGGINAQGSIATLENNTIAGNTSYRGGGLFLYAGGAALRRSIISGNTALEQGGGIWFWRDTSVLVNSVVTNNRLDYETGHGAGIYVDGGATPQFLHTTVARNTGGNGVGVHITHYAAPDFSAVAMTNSIIASHAIAGVLANTNDTATLDGTLWHANSANWAGPGVVNHAHDAFGAPAFAVDGFHLTAGSQAIDRGVTTGVAVDIDGASRPHGAGYDLGADEFTGEPVVNSRLYLPLLLRTR